MNSMVFRNLSYGVYIISTLDDGKPTGCVANSVMQITSSPATIAVSMNHDNYTNSCIKKSKMFAVSILSENSDPGLIGNFGFQSGKEVDKFKDINRVTKSSLPIVEGTCGYIVCKVIDSMESSTHTVFLGEAIDGDILDKNPPMTYAYYHSVIRGKSPKNAPTYIAEEDTLTKTNSSESSFSESKSSATYVCNICGHVYDGDIPFEELGDDYVCPVCKQPKSHFVKQ